MGKTGPQLAGGSFLDGETGELLMGLFWLFFFFGEEASGGDEWRFFVAPLFLRVELLVWEAFEIRQVGRLVGITRVFRRGLHQQLPLLVRCREHTNYYKQSKNYPHSRSPPHALHSLFQYYYNLFGDVLLAD